MIALLGLLVAYAAAAAPIVETKETSTILITNESPKSLAGCLQSSYFGAYGGGSQEHIYLPSQECLNLESSLQGLSSGSIVTFDGAEMAADEGRFVWIGRAGVEVPGNAGLLDTSSLQDAWETISTRSQQLFPEASYIEMPSEQVTFGLPTSSSPLSLIHQSSSSLLLWVPTHFLPILDTLLPRELVPVALPLQPLPSSSLLEWESVPQELIDNLANITKHLKFDVKLDSLLNGGIVMDNIRRDIRWLTGEGPSGIESRHSFSKGAIKAAHWIKDKVEATGASCHFHHYLTGFSPSVICSYPSITNSTEKVILSAHYDSRGSFGQTRAPGGDDDGSGTGHVLAVSKAIGDGKVQFEKNVILAFFSGEEQGLYGSHYYAEHLRKENDTVLFQLQADMLGYHAPGETMQLGLPESIGLPEATHLVANISQLYSPELLVGRTSACCSDHQSFVSYGFPATQVFERNGWIADPMYHNSGDVSSREGYDFDQIVSIAKVTMASILTVAGWSVGK